jgi:hypothetical protein
MTTCKKHLLLGVMDLVVNDLYTYSVKVRIHAPLIWIQFLFSSDKHFSLLLLENGAKERKFNDLILGR